jgi:hypothetical protein
MERSASGASDGARRVAKADAAHLLLAHLAVAHAGKSVVLARGDRVRDVQFLQRPLALLEPEQQGAVVVLCKPDAAQSAERSFWAQGWSALRAAQGAVRSAEMLVPAARPRQQVQALRALLVDLAAQLVRGELLQGARAARPQQALRQAQESARRAVSLLLARQDAQLAALGLLLPLAEQEVSQEPRASLPAAQLRASAQLAAQQASEEARQPLPSSA